MKLKPKVIHQLAQFVFSHMAAKAAWHIKADQGRMIQAIEGAIIDNLHDEEALDKEAKALLNQQMAKLPRGTEIDSHKAFHLIKRELAKKKKVVL